MTHCFYCYTPIGMKDIEFVTATMLEGDFDLQHETFCTVCFEFFKEQGWNIKKEIEQ